LILTLGRRYISEKSM